MKMPLLNLRILTAALLLVLVGAAGAQSAQRGESGAFLQARAGLDANHDVGVEAIISPADTVGLNIPLEPMVQVRNYGDTTETFWTLLTIGSVYQDSAQAVDLAPGDSTILTFPTWTPSESGQLQVEAYTLLLGDINPSNDFLEQLTTVLARDVGVLAITAPVDTVDSGAVVTPAARIRNFDTQPSGPFWCWFSVPGAYLDSMFVPGLGGGQESPLVFPEWPVQDTGWLVATCSTGAGGDINPENDTIRRDFFIRGTSYRDVIAVRVIEPAGSVRENTVFFPRCAVANNGWGAVEFQSRLKFLLGGSPVYEDSQLVTLAPGETDTLTFLSWTASPEGDFTARLTVFIEGDANPDNDTLDKPFSVGPIHDVGVEGIIAPGSRVLPGTLMPGARVHNWGDFTEQFWTSFRITEGGSTVYADSIMIGGLAPDSSALVIFTLWNATVGDYVASCSTGLADDATPANDKVEVDFRVRQPVIPGWHELEPMPGSEPVKDGGTAEYCEGTDGAGIYAVKGNKTNEFYRYDINGGFWQPLPSVPEGDKPVRKGAAMCFDGSHRFYLTKGNNTFEFYRYDMGDSGWSALPDVPEGPSGKKVKGGTDMAYVDAGDTGWVYLLKGYKTEFFRFNTVVQRWDQLEDAPIGVKDKWDKGSWLVYDGSRYLYAQKSKYYDRNAPELRHDMWRYDLSTSAWEYPALPGMPLYGLHGGRIKKKKSKDGGSAAWYDDAIYALKGANTQQVFRFDAEAVEWTEIDTFPTVGANGDRKRVKHGADIASSGDGNFYCLKGNKTNEFWRYGYSPGTGIERDPVVAPAPAGRPKFFPNPATGRVRLVLGVPGRVQVRVVDVGGRMVLEDDRVAGSGGVDLDLNGLEPGAYFLVVEQAGIATTAKLVID